MILYIFSGWWRKAWLALIEGSVRWSTINHHEREFFHQNDIAWCLTISTNLPQIYFSRPPFIINLPVFPLSLWTVFNSLRHARKAIEHCDLFNIVLVWGKSRLSMNVPSRLTTLDQVPSKPPIKGFFLFDIANRLRLWSVSSHVEKI